MGKRVDHSNAQHPYGPRQRREARRLREDARDAEIARRRLAEIQTDPASVVRGAALAERLKEMEEEP